MEGFLDKDVNAGQEEESIAETIRKIMEPYLANIEIPEDGDYRRQVREWQVEEYLKQSGKKSLTDFQNPNSILYNLQGTKE